MSSKMEKKILQLLIFDFVKEIKVKSVATLSTHRVKEADGCSQEIWFLLITQANSSWGYPAIFYVFLYVLLISQANFLYFITPVNSNWVLKKKVTCLERYL